MMNYDFGGAFKAKEGGNGLTAGIKDATFMGVEFAQVTSQKSSETFNTLALKLNIEGYGDYTQNFFEPQSNERAEVAWGVSASQLDHFLIMVREILEAVDPEIIKDVDAGKKKLTGNFKTIVNTVSEYTKSAIGTKLQVKLLPQSNGFVAMPTFVARITKNGDLGIATRVIGQNLTLTASEVNKIENAKKAKPTNMSKVVNVTDVLEAVSNDIESEDDLPF